MERTEFGGTVNRSTVERLDALGAVLRGWLLSETAPGVK